MNRRDALALSASIISRWVPDCKGLAWLLDDAGCARLAGAIRDAAGGPTLLEGGPHPDAALWAAQADRVTR